MVKAAWCGHSCQTAGIVHPSGEEMVHPTDLGMFAIEPPTRLLYNPPSGPGRWVQVHQS